MIAFLIGLQLNNEQQYDVVVGSLITWGNDSCNVFQSKTVSIFSHNKGSSHAEKDCFDSAGILGQPDTTKEQLKC